MPIRAHFLRTCCVFAVLMTGASDRARAGDPFNLINFLTGKSVDLKSHACDKCGHPHGNDEYCIERYPVEDCVVGKKKVFDSKIKFECVSIPETRYHLKKTLITKEIPCPYCKPICKTEDCQRCFGQEKWEKHCSECSELHCKHIEPVLEKALSKHCEHEEGETTIKVKYWSCVKVPYTVYRQVRQPVCVKQPRYVKVEVPVTRYVCQHCNGTGCSTCGK